jgi:hypothetical protein
LPRRLPLQRCRTDVLVLQIAELLLELLHQLLHHRGGSRSPDASHETTLDARGRSAKTSRSSFTRTYTRRISPGDSTSGNRHCLRGTRHCRG